MTKKLPKTYSGPKKCKLPVKAQRRLPLILYDSGGVAQIETHKDTMPEKCLENLKTAT